MAPSYLGKGRWFKSHLNSTFYQQSPKTDYAWIFKIVRCIKRTKCVQHCAACVFHLKIEPCCSASSHHFILQGFPPYEHGDIFFLLPAHKPRTNTTPTNKLEDKMKRIFRSEGSDVAAQRRSRVYVCVCAQGLGAAYRFEQFRPTKIQIDSTLGWEISSTHKHAHTHTQEQDCMSTTIYVDSDSQP